MVVKFTQELLGILSVFSKVTRVMPKDCFEDNQGLLTFIVPKDSVGKAVGKKAVHVKKLEHLFKKKIRIIGFADAVSDFIRNVVFPLKVRNVSALDLDEEVYVIEAADIRTRGLLIGRNAQNLRNTEAIVQRYFPIKELKVA